MKKIVLTLAALISIGVACAQSAKPWSVRMVDSEMKRFPKASDLDFMEGRLKWNYTTGLELLSFLDVYNRYGNEEIYDYVNAWADAIVKPDGSIITYKKENYNIDHICPGRILFELYQKTGMEKYRKALTMLRDQLATHPRTTDGGFWHKKVYPSQMWLDGLYMGEPFYAQYAKLYESGEAQKSSYEDIMHQFITVAKHTYDPATKLYRHAWDESRKMFWADKTTGQSEHAWGRALGWYVIGIVDALDYIPENTKGRKEVIEIFRKIYDVLPQYADPKTGMWYQVLDSPKREGNYQEATASVMFTYAMLKGVRKGYLDESLKQKAFEWYKGVIKNFIVENADGTISLKMCCAVAGLGGSDNRSGNFDYYIKETIRDNDPKGTAPFIWASLEYETMTKK